MIFCKELNKEFSSEEELFKALKKNKDFIINAKKSEVYESINKGLSVINNQESTIKALGSTKAFEMDEDYYYIVVNSSRILDSHKDVHIDGNWEKTIKEQQGKVYLVFDHTLKRSEIIAMKEDVHMFSAVIPFSLLGKSYKGDTYCLVYKIKKTKIINSDAKEWLEKGYSMEASVRMLYMDVSLALNSSNQNDVKEKKVFDKYYSSIANKDDFEEIRYFWAIKQAKNQMESSLVMFGSNSSTGVLREKIKTEPSIDTQQKEAVNDNTSHNSLLI